MTDPVLRARVLRIVAEMSEDFYNHKSALLRSVGIEPDAREVTDEGFKVRKERYDAWVAAGSPED